MFVSGLGGGPSAASHFPAVGPLTKWRPRSVCSAVMERAPLVGLVLAATAAGLVRREWNSPAAAVRLAGHRGIENSEQLRPGASSLGDSVGHPVP
jgi:hypothetical protein